MEAKLKLKMPHIRYTTEDAVVAFMFVSYFCSEALRSFFIRLFGIYSFDIIYNTVFILGIFYIFLTKKRNRLIAPFIVYIAIAFLFAFTIFMHPEYIDWYFEKTYGIQIQFFRMVGGIWAFLVVYLVPDKEKLYRYLKISCWILFVFLSLKFMSAQVRGYWVNYGADYSRLELSYDLGFGYDMLLPVIYFATEGILHKKKKYFIPFAIGSVLILMGGSRGAIIWVLVAFLILLLYKWNTLSHNQKILSIFLIVVISPVIWLIYVNYDLLSQGLVLFLTKRGISSRTISAILSGHFSDANGRDIIYQMTIDRIKEGGLFGNGVFGERIIVGQRFRWGYAHNLFLELYAAFGYLGGTLISLFLIIWVIKTAVRCTDTIEQIIFVTFLGASMKLMLSDSFWFNSEFWGLLAIMFMWKRHRYSMSLSRKTV